MSFLRLFNRFVLRALWQEKARSAVATFGIGIGVAVMIAIRLANVSVTETFRAAVDSVSGNTSLRIRGVSGRFNEQLFAQLRQRLSGVGIGPRVEVAVYSKRLLQHRLRFVVLAFDPQQVTEHVQAAAEKPRRFLRVVVE